MNGVRLRIEGDGPTAHGYRVFLDDCDISDATRAVIVNMSVGDANTATLEVYVDRLELGADVEAHLVDRSPERERTSFVSRFREWLR